MMELEQVYRDIHPKLFNFFYLKTSNIAPAEDLTQEIPFTRQTRAYIAYRAIPPSPPGYFPLHITFWKHCRSKKYEKAVVERLEVTLPADRPTSEQLIELKEEVQRLLAAIKKLHALASEIVLL